MAQNTGTLVVAPIRPLTDIMPIATAYSSEIKGGMHSVADISARNSITTDRREFGMLVYVISTTDFYQLRQIYSPDVADDTNWQLLQLGPSASSTGEWQDSVIAATSGDPSVLVPVNGDRYLVVSGAGAWTGKDGNIVEWQGSWTDIIPTEGMSVRDDSNQGPILSYFNGTWVEQDLGGDPYIEHTLDLGGSLVIATNSQYLVYGDFEINGAVQNYGEVVVLNGSVTGTGSISNLLSGSLQQVDMLTDIYGGTGVGIVSTSLSTRRVDLNLIAGTGVSLVSGSNSTIISSTYIPDSSFPSYNIITSDTVTIPAYKEMLVYGDLDVDGVLDINALGKVVVLNGDLNVGAGSTISNIGNIELYTLMSEQRLSQIHQSGHILGNSFSVGGTYAVTLGATYSDLNYSITVTGEIPRTWSLSNKKTTGFIVEANSVAGFTQSVYWQTMNY
jgi:hypothetical protein